MTVPFDGSREANKIDLGVRFSLLLSGCHLFSKMKSGQVFRLPLFVGKCKVVGEKEK